MTDNASIMNSAMIIAMPLSFDRFRVVMVIFYGSKAVTLGGVGWTRLMIVCPACCQTLNTLRGETFKSALVSLLIQTGHRIS